MPAVARVNQQGLRCEGSGKGQPFLQAGQVVAGYGLAGFDFDGRQRHTQAASRGFTWRSIVLPDANSASRKSYAVCRFNQDCASVPK